MRKLLLMIALVTLFTGCEKKGGKLELMMTYYTESDNIKSNQGLKSINKTTITQYSQFGNYITSITPSRFIGKFLHLRLSNWHENQAGGDELNIDFFDNSLEIANPLRLADFSNNSSVIFEPDEIEVRDNAELIYFIAVCLFFYQELELPEPYENLYGNSLQFLNFDGANAINFDGPTISVEKTGRFLKAGHEDFLAPIFNPNWTGFDGNYPVSAHSYVFGNTDTTFIFKKEDDQRTIDDPMGQAGYIVRSNNYTPVSISAIAEGETKTIHGTMSFNTTDLIQIYAGQDNTPYTSDDIFVYAPNFWERISVRLEYY
jgi:hypothetical protein